MSNTRLVPAYVERPAWKLYEVFQDFDGSRADDDLEALRDAVDDLRDALLRGMAVTHAPTHVVAGWLS